MVFTSPVRPWLVSPIILLVAMTVWGVLRYAHLPDQIPKHIGTSGVDAWTDRSIGSAFLLVFVYVGVTVLMVACAELTLRVTPRDELRSAAPFAGGPSSSLVNRPGSRASARRAARAVLLLNTSIGVSLLVGCGILWRSAPDPDIPLWMFAGMLIPLLAGTAVTVVVAVKDRCRVEKQ
ncbi:DUF1648 domain-containing protein [Streptomyces sp. MST-110588]|uniref:DUF1648 domain-containing protein n=1 Tax=Streptomyces sp. MST-110588 TaxID=2833628 RepID=UPI001F5DF7A2|nr:DUF1648 domain-containing protein [Streptomyces sp. MST-110588]UNO41704.1 DUF1648 domain-containing protein [Streptomyces sp. MST-110588]